LPSLEEILEAAMVITLVVAMLIFLFLIVAKVRRGSRLRGDFTLLLWAFIVGWLGAEVLEVLSPDPLDLLAKAIHFLVILLFSIFLGLRWRWAMRVATQEVEI
jgi:membrane protein DedA with SNARE-associated domain